MKDNGQCKWLKNVPVLILGLQRDNSYIGAIESALKSLKSDLDYYKLMAISGEGMIVRWYKALSGKRWGGELLPGIFTSEFKLLSELSWYEFEIVQDENDREKSKKKIIQSIDEGIPVLCLDRGQNLSVLFGYESEGEVMLLRPYIDSCAAEPDWDAAVRYEFNNLFPYYVFIKKSSVKEIDYSVSMIKGIIDSIKYYDMQKKEYNTSLYGKGFYYFGRAAYDQWMEDLKNFDGFSKEEQENLRFFTWWNAICIMDKRTAMSKVFRELAGAPYKTDTINSYIEMARLCSQQVTVLKKMTDDSSYDSSVSDFGTQVQKNIERIKTLKEYEVNLHKIFSSIADPYDI